MIKNSFGNIPRYSRTDDCGEPPYGTDHWPHNGASARTGNVRSAGRDRAANDEWTSCAIEISLLARAQRGEQAAMTSVLRPVAKLALSTARRVLGSRFAADAQTVAQDSLIAVARGLSRVTSQEQLRAFTVRTTLRHAVRFRKRSRVKTPTPFDPEPAAAPFEASRPRREHQADTLLSLLVELPLTQAEVLLMRTVFDLSSDKIAETLGLAKHTVRSQLRLGQVAINDKLHKRPSVKALLQERR